jgi:hypothetical protein
MQLVIDSNCLRDPQTRKYLAASTDNHVVFTDYLGMELYKSGSLPMVADLLNQVAEFSQQVIILIGTRAICQLHVPLVGATEALIDRRATSEFPDFCRWLAIQGTENNPILNQFHAAAASAANHLEAMSSVFADLQVDIAQVAHELPPSGLRQLRTCQPISAEMGRHIQRAIFTMAGTFFRAYGIADPGKTVAEYGHRFPFRHAVVAYLMVLGWIGTGGAVGKSRDKFRNDAVDSVLVTYATYFDGVLSHDQKLNELSANSREALKRLFGVQVGPM